MNRDHLEDRLQALLDDSGLDLPTRSDATGVVVSRVRRVKRRRRAVRTAVPAVLTVMAIAVGIRMTTLSDHHGTPSLTVADNVLTGTGIGPLQLGMNIAAAKAAGLVGAKIDNTDLPSFCDQYSGVGEASQILADRGTIVEIQVSASAYTPAGIHIGATYGELVQTYPESGPVVAHTGGVQFSAPGGAGNLYGVSFSAPADNGPLTTATKINSLALRAAGESGIGKCLL